MKTFFLRITAVVLAVSLLSACGGTSEATSAQDDTTTEASQDGESTDAPSEAAASAALTDEQKSMNVYKNFTIVFMGSLILAMSQSFGGMAKGMGEAVAGGDESKMAEMEEKIESMDDEIINKMDTLVMAFDGAFGMMKTAHPAAYEKLFKGDAMKEGIELAESADLPEGFEPLSHNLDQSQIKRYILTIASSEELAEDHPVSVLFKDMYGWFESVDAQYKSDPDIAAFAASMHPQ